jgi:hypothetical protein
MSQATNYLEEKIIDHIFRTASFAKPTVLAVALYTAAPGETGGGTETTYTNYARVQRDPLDANWAAPSGGNGQTSNVAALAFPAPGSGPHTLTHTGLLDATTVGNLLLYGALTDSRIINNGDAAPTFAAGTYVVTVA